PGAGGGGGGSNSKTITLAAVDNPQMADLKGLVSEFQKAHSDITVKIVTLPEDQLRQQVTQDVAANSGRYDLFTIGTYEVPLWAKKGWIENLSPYIAKDSSYDPNDLIPGIRGALSYQNNLYAVPFYGESSMLMYRKDAMWYDATVAASNFTGDAAKNSGYAFAPHVVKDWSGWLWAWALGMPSSSKKKDAAWTFADWATNKDYIKLVGQRLGWAHVP